VPSAYRSRLTAEKTKKFAHIGHVVNIETQKKEIQVLQALNVKKWCVELGLAESGWRSADSVVSLCDYVTLCDIIFVFFDSGFTTHDSRLNSQTLTIGAKYRGKIVDKAVRNY